MDILGKSGYFRKKVDILEKSGYFGKNGYWKLPSIISLNLVWFLEICCYFSKKSLFGGFYEKKIFSLDWTSEIINLISLKKSDKSRNLSLSELSFFKHKI